MLNQANYHDSASNVMRCYVTDNKFFLIIGRSKELPDQSAYIVLDRHQLEQFIEDCTLSLNEFTI